MNDTETKKAFKRKHVLVDVMVEADLSSMVWGSFRRMTEEEKAKELERACKEFSDFLRDHRSQDMVRLDVNRIYKDLCSACGCDELDYDSETKELYCAGCGAVIIGEEPTKAIEDKDNEVH